MTKSTHIPTTCTHGPSAITGERCGKPAVHTFTGSDGTVYAECAEHSTAHVAAAARPSDRRTATFTATFRDGYTKTRRSVPGRYTHAVKRTRRVSGPGAVVITFHKGADAARAIAGKGGEIVEVVER